MRGRVPARDQGRAPKATATPGSAGAGDLLTFDTCAGWPGDPALLYSVTGAGALYRVRIAKGRFDALGRWSFGATVPAGLSGLTVQPVTFAIAERGKAVASNLAAVVFL